MVMTYAFFCIRNIFSSGKFSRISRLTALSLSSAPDKDLFCIVLIPLIAPSNTLRKINNRLPYKLPLSFSIMMLEKFAMI